MLNWTDGRIPINTPIPYDFGKHFYFGWISYMVVLVFGVILNSIALSFMIFNKKISKKTPTIYLMYLAWQDFFASVVCLVQCAVNLRFFMIFGENIACIIEAWQICFFVGISGFSVCLYGYYLKEKTMATTTRYLVGLDGKGLFKIHLMAWIIYAILSIFATLWPGRSRPLSSGTYCMPAFEDTAPSIFFFGLIVFPCATFLLTNYYSIYANYVKSNKNVKEDFGIERKTNIRLITQFLSFVAVYCLFYLPFFLAACYEWATKFHSSVYFDFIAGVMTHLVSALNPVMYVLTTKPCKREFERVVNFIKPTPSCSAT